MPKDIRIIETKELDLQEVKDRAKKLRDEHDAVTLIDIDPGFPEEVQELIREENERRTQLQSDLEMEASGLDDQVEKYKDKPTKPTKPTK